MVTVLLILCVLTGTISEAAAETLHGIVIEVQDGDTLKLLVDGKTQHRVRLAGIDAPEKGQPFGSRSKEALAALVHGRSISVEWRKRDRYGRVIGTVQVGGNDVNLAQIERGFAWHYLAYVQEQSRADQILYSQAESSARRTRVGLWRDPTPVPPWTFRKAKREQGR